MENRISKIFKKLKSENKKAFISFTTAGFPEEDASLEIIKSIVDSGAHIHEISVPHAEAQADEENELKLALKKENIALIKLITPTTSDERIKKLVKNAEGFIYSVNVAGITGVKNAEIDKVNSQIERIKRYTDIPVAAGFGIKTPEDVKKFSKSNADGIIIGSAIVEKIQEVSKKNKDKYNIANFVKDFCKELIENLNS